MCTMEHQLLYHLTLYLCSHLQRSVTKVLCECHTRVTAQVLCGVGHTGCMKMLRECRSRVVVSSVIGVRHSTPCICCAHARARRCHCRRTPCSCCAPARARRCHRRRTPCNCCASARARRCHWHCRPPVLADAATAALLANVHAANVRELTRKLP